ncbi:hypothetical protein M0R45_019442 [Rubus argutus]|uniref:Uncharacterized protein n=1 Tax=Rubus argutus TaxID=59490 RepID=A0AAW1X5V8_RUBAR
MEERHDDGAVMDTNCSGEAEQGWVRVHRAKNSDLDAVRTELRQRRQLWWWRLGNPAGLKAVLMRGSLGF